MHLLGFVDVAPIDENGAAHHTLNLWHIERFELVPLGHHYQRVGIFCYSISIFAESNIVKADTLAFESLAPGLQRDRVVDTHQRPLACYPTDNVDRSRLAHIVGIWLEGQAEDTDGAAAQRAEDVGQLRHHESTLIMI